MNTVKVNSGNEEEALLEKIDGAAPGHYVIRRNRRELSVEEFIKECPAGRQFETDLTKILIRVYAIETSETLFQRFECGLEGVGTLYFDRQIAQAEADSYNEEFPNDEEPAWVADLDVL